MHASWGAITHPCLLSPGVAILHWRFSVLIYWMHTLPHILPSSHEYIYTSLRPSRQLQSLWRSHASPPPPQKKNKQTETMTNYVIWSYIVYDFRQFFVVLYILVHISAIVYRVASGTSRPPWGRCLASSNHINYGWDMNQGIIAQQRTVWNHIASDNILVMGISGSISDLHYHNAYGMLWLEFITLLKWWVDST